MRAARKKVYVTKAALRTDTKAGMAPAFLAKLRAGARCYLDAYAPRLAFSSRALRVAVHLRRGDVDAKTRGGFVTDDTVLRALAWIENVTRSVAPAALAVDRHVFTSTIANEALFRKKYTRRFWTSADFDVYRHRGVRVHIDVEGRGGAAKHQLLTTDAGLLHWAHWATADVFLAGRSSFSSVPKLRNQNCAINPPYAPTDANRECVARAVRARAAELSVGPGPGGGRTADGALSP